MRGKNIKRYSIGNLPKSKTNWDIVKNMSEEEVERRALADSDALPATEKELARAKRVFPPKHINVKKIRRKLHVSQDQFASSFGLNKRTIQQWEQGRSEPRGAAKVLLAVIENDPMSVHKALLKAHGCK